MLAGWGQMNASCLLATCRTSFPCPSIGRFVVDLHLHTLYISIRFDRSHAVVVVVQFRHHRPNENSSSACASSRLSSIQPWRMLVLYLSLGMTTKFILG